MYKNTYTRQFASITALMQNKPKTNWDALFASILHFKIDTTAALAVALFFAVSTGAVALVARSEIQAADYQPILSQNSNSRVLGIASYGYNQPVCGRNTANCLNHQLTGFNNGGWQVRIDYQLQQGVVGAVRVNGWPFMDNIAGSGSGYTGNDLLPGKNYNFVLYRKVGTRLVRITSLNLTAPRAPDPTSTQCPVIGAPPENGCYYDNHNNRCGTLVCSPGYGYNTPPPVNSCPQDTYQCPDGKWVSRTGSSCQFVCNTPAYGYAVSAPTPAPGSWIEGWIDRIEYGSASAPGNLKIYGWAEAQGAPLQINMSLRNRDTGAEYQPSLVQPLDTRSGVVSYLARVSGAPNPNAYYNERNSFVVKFENLPAGYYYIHNAKYNGNLFNVHNQAYQPIYISGSQSAYRLKSRFFRNDSLAESVAAGDKEVEMPSTTIGDNILPSQYPLAWKFLQGLRYLGYSSENYGMDKQPSIFLFNLFQKNNALPLTDRVSQADIKKIDQLLVNREEFDSKLSSQFPLTGDIMVPANVPDLSREHLGALWATVFKALPQNLVDWSSDNFLGYIRAQLPADQGATGAVVTSGNRICFVGISPYFSNACDQADKIKDNYVYTDFSFVYMLVHEYAHYIDQTLYAKGTGSMGAINPTSFYDISFDSSYKCNVPLGYEKWGFAKIRRPENLVNEYVSNYSSTGFTSYSDAYCKSRVEDWAESFAMYVLEGNVFRELAKTRPVLQSKHDWLKQNVFFGREYQTGNIANLSKIELGRAVNPLPSLLSYTYFDTNFVWDYQFPYSQSVETPRVGRLIYLQGTVFLVGEKGVYGIPSLDVFNSWGLRFSDVVEANSMEKSLPQIGVMPARSPYCNTPLEQIENRCPVPSKSEMKVLSPNGGEILTKGQSFNIKWTSQNFPANSYLYIYLQKDKYTYATVATNVPVESGAYSWAISNDYATAGGYEIYLSTSYGIENGKNIGDSSDAPFSIVTSNYPSVAVLSPNGGEMWEIGKTYAVRWSSANLTGNVDILITKASLGSGGLAYIVKNIPNTGFYTWNTSQNLIPPPNSMTALLPGSDYTITIRNAEGSYNAGDQSDQPFSITSAASVTPAASLGPVSLSDYGMYKGKIYRIKWDSAGVDKVYIKLRKNSVGDTVRAISETIVNNGYFDWTVPGDLADGYDYVVRAVGAGTSLYADSPVFGIKAEQPAYPTYRYIKIETSSSNSWVAWREAEVYGINGQKIIPVNSSASSSYSNSVPERAYDGNTGTVWNSGSYSNGSIVLDLGTDAQISKIRLLPANYPNPATTTHYVRGKTSGASAFTSITQFGGQVYDNQWLEYSFNNP